MVKEALGLKNGIYNMMNSKGENVIVIRHCGEGVLTKYLNNNGLMEYEDYNEEGELLHKWEVQFD